MVEKFRNFLCASASKLVRWIPTLTRRGHQPTLVPPTRQPLVGEIKSIWWAGKRRVFTLDIFREPRK